MPASVSKRCRAPVSMFQFRCEKRSQLRDNRRKRNRTQAEAPNSDEMWHFARVSPQKPHNETFAKQFPQLAKSIRNTDARKPSQRIGRRPARVGEQDAVRRSSRFINLIAAFAAGAIVLAATGGNASAATRMVARSPSRTRRCRSPSMAARRSNGRSRPRAGAMSRRPARSSRPGCTRCGTRANTTRRRCRIRCSSTAATRCMPPTAIKRLGRPASHGCIRLHPDNASDFYQLVETVGPANTSIVIVNQAPAAPLRR